MIKRVSKIIFVLFILVLLSSCSSIGETETVKAPELKESVLNTPAETNEGAEKIVLQTWVYDSFAYDSSAPIYGLADKYMEQNPNIEIKIIPTQYGSTPYRDKFITAAQAGEGRMF